MTALFDDLLHCMEQPLQGRHPLLTIDDLVPGHVTGHGWSGFVDDGAKEVLWNLRSRFRLLGRNVALRDANNVIP